MSKGAEIEVSEDSVGESVEFFLVNNSWSSGVNSLSGGFNPGPLVSGDGVVLGSSELLKTNFDLIVGEGTIVVGIEMLETFSGKCVGDALSSWVWWVSGLGLSSKFAEVEVLEDGVGESEEFASVNNSWGSGVNLLSSGLEPLPFFWGDGVVKGFSEFLKTNFDLSVGEGTILVGIEGIETFIGESLCNTDSWWSLDSDGRGGGDKGSNGEFHF